MKYDDFVKKIKRLSYFKGDHLSVFSKNDRTLRNQLVEWQKKGKIHRLKRGMYTLNDEERKASLPPFLISNILYAPSYVSLEVALSFWNLIPEAVYGVTAVTTKKTVTFKNTYGNFFYQTLHKRRFFGYLSVKEKEVTFLVAEPEKAILDKIYFDPQFKPEPGYFLEGLRLQHFERLRTRKLLDYAKRFESKKILKGAKVLALLMKEERT